MNYYPHHIGDYSKDTAHLSLIEHGAYRRLMDLYYSTEAPLPVDKSKIYRLLLARDKAEKDAINTILTEYFALESDGWHKARCDKEIAKAQEKRTKAAESAAMRWQKSGNANAFQKKSEGNAPNPNPNPNPNPKTAHTEVKEPPATRADPALPETPKPETTLPAITTAGAWAIDLKRRGMDVTSMHPTLLQWIDDGFTLPAVIEAYERACGSVNPPDKPGPKYVDKVLRNPKKPAEPPWWLSGTSINRKGRELGLFARPGEEMEAFKTRIQAAIRDQKAPQGQFIEKLTKQSGG